LLHNIPRTEEVRRSWSPCSGRTEDGPRTPGHGQDQPARSGTRRPALRSVLPGLPASRRSGQPWVAARIRL